MHPSDLEALETIDAAVFSGDAFFDKENRKTLRDYMARWERGLQAAESLDEIDVES